MRLVQLGPVSQAVRGAHRELHLVRERLGVAEARQRCVAQRFARCRHGTLLHFGHNFGEAFAAALVRAPVGSLRSRLWVSRCSRSVGANDAHQYLTRT